MQPLISIIIPAYNAEKTLWKCLNSIIEQTWPRWEVILVDDGSSDNTLDIGHEYAAHDPRFVVYHKTNGGQSSARNLGLEHISGEYFTFVDSDDYIYPNMLKELYNGICRRDSDIAVCGMDILKNEKKRRTYRVENSITTGQEAIMKNFLLGKYSFGPMQKLFRSKQFKDIRYVEGIIFEDVEYLSRVFLYAKNVITISYIGYCYIVHSSSTVHSPFNPKKLDLIRVTNLIADRVQDSKVDCPDELQAFILDGYESIIFLAMTDNVCKAYESDLIPLIHWIRNNLFQIFKNCKVTTRRKVYALIIAANCQLCNKLLTMIRG